MSSGSDSRFLEVLGASPENRVLDFLMRESVDRSLTEIARLSGVGYSTLQLFWPRLVRAKLVIQTRRIGKARLFVLNRMHPAAGHLRRLAGCL